MKPKASIQAFKTYTGQRYVCLDDLIAAASKLPLRRSEEKTVLWFLGNVASNFIDKDVAVRRIE